MLEGATTSGKSISEDSTFGKSSGALDFSSLFLSASSGLVSEVVCSETTLFEENESLLVCTATSGLFSTFSLDLLS